MPPCVSRGNLFGVYPLSDESAHVWQIWCHSVQPFGSSSRICANVSSSLSRATRAKTRQKQHLCIEHYNSGLNMQTSTSLTFFTAIFLAFSGALAEEVMAFCRHVTTELYWLLGLNLSEPTRLQRIICSSLCVCDFGSALPTPGGNESQLA